MGQRSGTRRLHWLCWQPTPYNDFLFRSLAKESDVDLTVHFRELALASHPWQSKLAQQYRARFYQRFLGIDWHVLLVALKEKKAFFVVAGWNHLTVLLLITFLGLTGRRFALWTDTPDLNRKRNPFFALLRSRWLEWVFHRATKILGTGEPGVKALGKMGAPASKLENFPYFIDLDAYRPSGTHPPTDVPIQIRFISVGRMLNDVKGHDTALRALALAATRCNRSFEYLIAGTGPDEPYVHALTQELGLVKQVRFLGWVEQAELQRVYGTCHVLIHPSPNHDPYGNAVLEGMASGLVILGSDATGAVNDRVEHGINGFIHRAGDVGELARHIEFILRNPDWIVEMGKRGRSTVEEWPIERGIGILKALLNEAP